MTAPTAALGHDYLLVMRGAERTFLEMAGCWPDAPIYTTLYDEAGTGGAFARREVVTSPLQRLGVRQSRFRALLPLFPAAVRRLRPTAELLVTSSSAFAIGIPKAPGGFHACYCHTPFRYAHHERQRALSEVPAPVRPALAATLAAIRRSDLRAAARVDAFIANSETTRERIAQTYGRDSVVVHPPVAVERFAGAEAPTGEEPYLLCVTELVRHKGVELALEAAEMAGRRMVVVGSGPEHDALEARFGSIAEFRGRATDAELDRLYLGADAVVVPTVEEFGIVAVEAQAAGRPVIAPREGGASETVVDRSTGVLVDQRTAAGFAEALRDTDFSRFDPAAARANAAQFAPERFRERLQAAVEAAMRDA
jgi:glycosyltransferase involved in cell wall biosynthesis